MPTAVLIGTLDTKGREYAYVRDQLTAEGLDVLVVDVGVLGEPSFSPDVSAEVVAEAAGISLEELRFSREGSDTRAVAVAAMREGAAEIVRRLLADGRCDGVLGMGGSGGSAIISGAMQAAPFGIPKLLVSTMASGDVSHYVGSKDMCILHSVTDIAGLNMISRPILSNAAGALAGMIRARLRVSGEPSHRLGVGITMLGVTTRGALRVAERLEDAGYDPVVFHAVGSGGKAMESLLAEGVLGGVIDYTIKEVADDVFGGIFNAGPDRLRTAGRMGLPQVVVPGAIEVLNFGAADTVPPHLADGSRPIVHHNAEVTAVRLSKDELVRIAEEVAARLNEGSGPLRVVIPRCGFDSYSVQEGPFHDIEGATAFITALQQQLKGGTPVVTVETDINDPAFADLVADTFVALERSRHTGAGAE